MIQRYRSCVYVRVDNLDYLVEVSRPDSTLVIRWLFTFDMYSLALDYYSSTARMSPTIRITMPTTTTTTTVTTTMRSPHACNPFELGSCMNGGRCLATVHSYRCLCQSGYTGHFCEMSKSWTNFFLKSIIASLRSDINECASNPCKYLFDPDKKKTRPF